MKKFLWTCLCSALCLVCLFAGCNGASDPGGDGNSSDVTIGQPNNPTLLELTETNVTMRRFESTMLGYTVYDQFDTEMELDATMVSSNEDVLKIEDGNMLVAYGIGTAEVTVTCSGLTQKCSVTVEENPVLPKLTLSESAIELGVNTAFTVTPNVTFNGYNQSGVDFTFQTGDASVASVDANGKVTGVKKGVTSLTVTTTYKGMELIEQISVTVNTSISLGWNISDGTSVYTSNVKNGATQLNGAPAIFEDGQAITPAAGSIRYYECDEQGDELGVAKGIVNVSEDGTITASVRGETYLRYTWTKSADEAYTSDVLHLVSDIPVLDTKVLVKGEMYGANLLTYDRFLPQLNLTSETIVDAVMVIGGVETPLTVTAEGIDGVTYRAKEILLFNDAGYAQRIALDVVTLIISNAEELDAMSQYLEDNKTFVKEYEYAATATDIQETEKPVYYATDGYFVLDQDIDYNGQTYVSKLKTMISNEKITYGFTGTFDGRGHTISNIVFGASTYRFATYKNSDTGKTGEVQVKTGGLFTAMSTTAIVKNLNVEMQGTHLLAGTGTSGTLEDVSIKMSKVVTANYTGVLAGSFLKYFNMNRVVMYIGSECSFGSVGSEVGFLCHDVGNCMFREFYVIDEFGALYRRGREETAGKYMVGEELTDCTYVPVGNSLWNKHSTYGNPVKNSMKDSDGNFRGAYFESVENFKAGIQTDLSSSTAMYDVNGNPLMNDKGDAQLKYSRVLRSEFAVNYAAFDPKKWDFEESVPTIKTVIENGYDHVVDFDDIIGGND